MSSGTGAEPGQPWGGEASAPTDPFAEWRAERDQYHPDSFQYQQLSAVLAELGDPEVQGAPVEGQAPKGEPGAPPGFATVEELGFALVAARQFYGRIPGLYDPHAVYRGPTVELTTDTSHRVRLVDLRSVLNGKMHSIAPTPEDQLRLDEHFFRDLGALARTGGQPRLSVRSSRGPAIAFYSRIIRTKLRAFFVPAATENFSGEGVRIFARIGDCGNDDAKEIAFYRRLFGRKLRLS